MAVRFNQRQNKRPNAAAIASQPRYITLNECIRLACARQAGSELRGTPCALHVCAMICKSPLCWAISWHVSSGKTYSARCASRALLADAVRTACQCG